MLNYICSKIKKKETLLRTELLLVCSFSNRSNMLMWMLMYFTAFCKNFHICPYFWEPSFLRGNNFLKERQLFLFVTALICFIVLTYRHHFHHYEQTICLFYISDLVELVNSWSPAKFDFFCIIRRMCVLFYLYDCLFSLLLMSYAI